MPDHFPGSGSASKSGLMPNDTQSRPPHSPMHNHTGLLSPAPIKHTPSSGASYGTHRQSHNQSQTASASGGGTSGSSASTGTGTGTGTGLHLSLPGNPKSPNFFHHYSGAGINTPLSLIRGFPDMSGTAPGGLSPNPQTSGYINSSGGSNTDATFKLDRAASPLPFVNAPDGVATMGLTPFTSGAEATTLPQVSSTHIWSIHHPTRCSRGVRCTDKGTKADDSQFWADMFGIKLDGDQTLAL